MKERSKEDILETINWARLERTRLQKLIREQNAIINQQIAELENLAEFEVGDKVLLTEQYGNKEPFSTEVYIGNIVVLEDTKDGEPFYRFNQCKKDGSISKNRHYTVDKIVSIVKT